MAKLYSPWKLLPPAAVEVFWGLNSEKNTNDLNKSQIISCDIFTFHCHPANFCDRHVCEWRSVRGLLETDSFLFISPQIKENKVEEHITRKKDPVGRSKDLNLKKRMLRSVSFVNNTLHENNCSCWHKVKNEPGGGTLFSRQTTSLWHVILLPSLTIPIIPPPVSLDSILSFPGWPQAFPKRSATDRCYRIDLGLIGAESGCLVEYITSPSPPAHIHTLASQLTRSMHEIENIATITHI